MSSKQHLTSVIRLLLLLSFSLGGTAYGSDYRPFAYPQTEYSLGDKATHVGVVYGVSWVLYPLVQPKVMSGETGSWGEYGENFGRLVFDQDEPIWNWMVHPLSGSQLYLFYRALGYDRPTSFGMTFVSSALFEFTVEIYSEPASVQDLYQTPVFGTVLGLGIEKASVYLLNSPSGFSRFFGRLINPLSYIVDEQRVSLIPVSDFKGRFGLNFKMDW